MVFLLWERLKYELVSPYSIWMGDTKLQGFPWLRSYVFISPPQAQEKHCIARSGAGAGFPSAVKMEVLEPLHFGLSQETASSWGPLDHCPLWQRPVCEMCARLLLAAGHFFYNRAQMLTQSQLSLASCLQNLFYEVNVYAFRLPLGLYTHSAHGCRINLFLQLAKE